MYVFLYIVKLIEIVYMCYWLKKIRMFYLCRILLYDEYICLCYSVKLIVL